MFENISDIDILASKCKSEESKLYISEAILCYKSGAFRAAIVSTWIAVVFDLIDKISYLSKQGNGAATIQFDRYQNYIQKIEQGDIAGIRGAGDYERELLSICRDKLQLLDPQQFIDLSRLKDDRHRCAHPSFHRLGVPYYPSAEQARLHIRNAVAHVLALPPIQGRAALEQLKIEIASEYFPTTTTEAIAKLKTGALNRATDALIKGFVDELVYGFLDSNGILHRKKQAISAINAILNIYPGVSESRFKEKLNKVLHDLPDEKIRMGISLTVFVEDSMRLLEPTSVDRIKNFILRSPTAEVVRTLGALEKAPLFFEAVSERVNELSLEDLSKSISGGLKKGAIKKALQYFSEVGSWNSADKVFSLVIAPLMPIMTKEHYKEIIEMPKLERNDLRGSAPYNKIISHIISSNIYPRDELEEQLRSVGAGYLIRDEDPNSDDLF